LSRAALTELSRFRSWPLFYDPAKYASIINLKTAKTPGLAIPPGVFCIADQMIE